MRVQQFLGRPVTSWFPQEARAEVVARSASILLDSSGPSNVARYLPRILEVVAFCAGEFREGLEDKRTAVQVCSVLLGIQLLNLKYARRLGYAAPRDGETPAKRPGGLHPRGFQGARMFTERF